MHKNVFPSHFPEQHQDRHPGIESIMNPRPVFELEGYNLSSDRLKDKVAIVTGGDSGIGRAVALAFAKEGAKVIVHYFDETEDAEEIKSIIEERGGCCKLIAGDISEEQFCTHLIETTYKEFGKIDILVNNAAVQYVRDRLEDISSEQFIRTCSVNIFGAFYLTKAVLPYLECGSSIINTTSVVAFRGHKTLIDYTTTKGALTAFTRSMALNLADRGIRVNAVAPGPVWTPFIVSSFNSEDSSVFGADTPLGRAGQPVEISGAYVFLASQDASYITGQTINVNGGEIINC